MLGVKKIYNTYARLKSELKVLYSLLFVLELKFGENAPRGHLDRFCDHPIARYRVTWYYVKENFRVRYYSSFLLGIATGKWWVFVAIILFYLGFYSVLFYTGLLPSPFLSTDVGDLADYVPNRHPPEGAEQKQLFNNRTASFCTNQRKHRKYEYGIVRTKLFIWEKGNVKALDFIDIKAYVADSYLDRFAFVYLVDKRARKGSVMVHLVDWTTRNKAGAPRMERIVMRIHPSHLRARGMVVLILESSFESRTKAITDFKRYQFRRVNMESAEFASAWLIEDDLAFVYGSVFITLFIVFSVYETGCILFSVDREDRPIYKFVEWFLPAAKHYYFWYIIMGAKFTDIIPEDFWD